jgi:NADH-quinone oxidoreductase subunit L
MSNPGAYLWLIPALPLLGSVLIAALGRPLLKENSHWPCVIGAGGACLFALLTLVVVWSGYPPEQGNGGRFLPTYFTWFDAGNVHVGITLRADGLTAVMLVMITFVGTLIAVFSIGYMHGDPGYPRFFAEFSLFVFFMTGLVLASNFIVLYACWEGVGLCSYLLIGFWYQRPSAAAAARKAFLVTRLGDIGLFLGILVLWAYHPSHKLEYDQIFSQIALEQYRSEGVLLPACLLIFVGCIGKSAQFPLHVWLPDAMEGPTPVSALIHAATMVTAGVYLVARCMPLFGLEPVALLVVAAIGGFTALLTAAIAVTQTDLKRVLAYSTISQLGYMFLALGCGVPSHRLAAFAVAAAIFHLFTHAFFKALLFLSAGSVMHAMGDVIDMRRFSGLRMVLPTTHWTFLCGAGALSGFPLLFSGFWSKDEILAVNYAASDGAGGFGTVYLLLFLIGLTTAGITAFYTARAYFMTFWGELRIPPEAFSHAHAAGGAADAHSDAGQAAEPATPQSRLESPRHEAAPSHAAVHESPPVMTWPLMILAAGAVLVGVILGPTGIFEGLLEHHWMHTTFPHEIQAEPATSHFSFAVMTLSSAFALAGIGLAYWMYVREPGLSEQLARWAAAAYELSRNKFYLDELYEALIVGPVTAAAHVIRILDQYLVDGLVDLVGQLPASIGYLLRPAQNGLVQFYALLMMLGVAGFVVAVLLR